MRWMFFSCLTVSSLLLPLHAISSSRTSSVQFSSSISRNLKSEFKNFFHSLTISMASALLTNSIYALKHQPKITFGHPKLAPKAAYVPKLSKNNNPLPEFQIDEYRTMKAKKINKALDEAVPLILQHPTTLLGEAMSYTLLAGGKHVFGTLCIASCELVGGIESSVMPMACAAVMLITMFIILDDLPCLDNDDLCCFKPAKHKVFGEATAVVASHCLISLAIEHIAAKTKNVSPDRFLGSIVEICSAVGSKGLMAGQISDINSEGKEVSLSELEFIHRHKYGNLMEASVVCGDLIGGGNEEVVERLRRYGKCVGLVYQVWDDILDVTGMFRGEGQESWQRFGA